MAAAVLTIRVAIGVSRGAPGGSYSELRSSLLDAKAPYFYDRLMNMVGRPTLGRGDLLY